MQVDFYILQSSAHAQSYARERFVCRLTHKIWQQGHRLYIYSDHPKQINLLDKWLWTFAEDSFLPHDRYPDEAEHFAPVRLGCNTPDACPQTTVLLNLATQVPAFYHQYARIAEVVSQDAAVKEAGRQRYRFYQQAGANLNTHTL
jgi:DNA polymerase-3 subunit chi